MQIRPIEDADIPAVAALISELAREFILPEWSAEASENFLLGNDEAAIRNFIADGLVYHVALIDGVVAGFVAVRHRSHLYHMFVAKARHGQGIGRALWETARRAAIAAGGCGEFTVNASNHALFVYRALGFEASGPAQNVNGALFNPMRLARSTPAFVGTP